MAPGTAQKAAAAITVKDRCDNIFTGRCSPLGSCSRPAIPMVLPASSYLHSTGENEHFASAPQGHWRAIISLATSPVWLTAPFWSRHTITHHHTSASNNQLMSRDNLCSTKHRSAPGQHRPRNPATIQVIIGIKMRASMGHGVGPVFSCSAPESAVITDAVGQGARHIGLVAARSTDRTRGSAPRCRRDLMRMHPCGSANARVKILRNEHVPNSRSTVLGTNVGAMTPGSRLVDDALHLIMAARGRRPQPSANTSNQSLLIRQRGIARLAVMAGDPDKPGLFVQMLTLLKGTNFSRPHVHPGPLFTIVSSGACLDPDCTGTRSPRATALCRVRTAPKRSLTDGGSFDVGMRACRGPAATRAFAADAVASLQ